jgi:hypothetical protein
MTETGSRVSGHVSDDEDKDLGLVNVWDGLVICRCGVQQAQIRVRLECFGSPSFRREQAISGVTGLKQLAGLHWLGDDTWSLVSNCCKNAKILRWL